MTKLVCISSNILGYYCDVAKISVYKVPCSNFCWSYLKGLRLYLVQRYVLDQPANHCPGWGLSHVNLLHIETVGIWMLLGCDYTSNTQVQARNVHLGILLAGSCLLFLCFLPSWHQRAENTAKLIMHTNTHCLEISCSSSFNLGYVNESFIWQFGWLLYISSTEHQTVAIHHVLKKGLLKRWICECFHAITIV